MALNFNPIKKAVTKGGNVSIEKNSKGDKVTWLRLDETIKDNASKLVTSKNNVEYSCDAPKVDIESALLWLGENKHMVNVLDWFDGLFIAANRPLLATAGASGLSECELIGDIESLVAFDTLQTARGRKASKLDSEAWKLYAPILSECLGRFFSEKKIQNVTPLVNKYLHLIKGAIVYFSPIGDESTMNKASEMIQYTFMWIVANKPDMEAAGAFAVQVMESNKAKYSIEEGSEY
jgi:hypothetical protein